MWINRKEYEPLQLEFQALLRQLDLMERASMRVLDNLQQMGFAAMNAPSVSCSADQGHVH